MTADKQLTPEQERDWNVHPPVTQEDFEEKYLVDSWDRAHVGEGGRR
jgi:hypothetical protein